MLKYRMVKNEHRPVPVLARPKTAPSKCGSTQNMASNIKVAVRVRPLNGRETGENSRVVVDVVDDEMLVFDPKEEIRPFFYHGVQQPNKNFLKRANKELKFVFDNVCGQNASNRDVFETTTKDMIASLMEGYNCSVFVYGATGAGKTFTMIGNVENPGITYLTMEHLFCTIHSHENDREFDIAVSYIEVYNENVYDLLKPSKTPLQLREDHKYGVTIAGLTLFNIKTAQELLHMLESGNMNRTQHPTDANAESSRSHAVFQVYVKMRNKTSSQLRIVKLSMIDLAGSERASATGCVGDRFKEGANINRSLLALGNCINKLADGSCYIPYRDSKLTRLLKDSLGGNCKTVMIANISPSSLSYEDTYNTLKYAARANKIQLSIKKNIVDGNLRASQHVKINEELKKKIKELEAKISLMSVKVVKAEPDPAKERLKQDWRRRLLQEEDAQSTVEGQLLSLMSRQRVLALRQRLRTRASHVAELAHRSSTELMDQVYTEELPRKERAVENYMKQSSHLDSKVMAMWATWDKCRNRLNSLCEQAKRECPGLTDILEVQQRSEIRHLKAENELRLKLLTLYNEEIDMLTEYTSVMPSLLKKLYLTLKGYDKVPPALTDEYLEIIKKAKAIKGITWSDEDIKTDAQSKFILNLDINQPSTTKEFIMIDNTVDTATDSDVTEADFKEPVKMAAKRKCTPIKQQNNDTITIDDSFESLDIISNMNSAKKVKKEFDAAIDVENLNSTFVMAGKIDLKPFKSQMPTRGLTDSTNTMQNVQRTITFNSDRAKKITQVVGKALPFRRPGSAAPFQRPGSAAPRGPGFGSSLARDGTPLARNVQVRARDRFQNHPYSRAAVPARK